jgi:signal transduction histidine kinase
MNRAAHEVKGPLNGIALNLEVLRTRIEAGKTDQKSLAPFADAAYQEFETAAARTEALLFLGRDGGTSHGDVAVTLKHLAQLLIPAAKADGTSLSVEGYDLATESAAPPAAIRLALASGLLALIKEGGGKCLLTANKAPDDTADATAVETVVRFSHQSATAVDLDPEVTSALQQHGIKARRSPQDLTIVFP